MRGSVFSSFLAATAVLLWVLLASPFVLAQGTTPPTRSAQETARETSLIGIVRSIEKLNRELSAKQEEMRAPSGEGRRDELTQQVQGIVARLNALQRSFDEIAAGVDPESLTTKEDAGQIDWSKDLREILSPILNEVRRLTSRPRELDRLRTAIEESESQIAVINQAERSLKKQIDAARDPSLTEYLKVSLHDFEARRQAIQTQLSISKQKLDQRLAEQQSFSDSVHNIFQLFFRSRGLNLFLALMSAVLFWLVARRVHALSRRFFPVDPSQRNFYSRLLSVLFTVSTLFGAVLVFLFALYFVGDWVLLILALMLLLGIIWASKQAVHQFWAHATLLLNMGVAREGERVFYNGVAWRLDSLNFYSRLVNPELAGGELYLPIRDLSELRSRDYDEREPWFPTRQNDWVLLSDGTVGKVALQTMDSVVLAILGGGERVIPSGKFMEDPPRNLSRGFRHNISFGVDYAHQAIVTSEIPATLRSSVETALAGTAWADALVNLRVEFDEAAASSLNLAVIADFRGEVAADYSRIRRFLNAACVDACNRHGWTIPFQQVTVHMAGASFEPGAKEIASS